MKLKLDPVTLRRFAKFRSIRRSWWSLLLIAALYLLSLFSDFLANDKPIVAVSHGRIHLPIIRYVPESAFTGTLTTEPDYKDLQSRGIFREPGSFVLFPPIPWGMNESDLTSTPPSPPSFRHLLGTDDRGRDVFSRLLYGFRISLTFSLVIVLITVILAVVIGGVQGYFGGWVDLAFQRVIEILSTLPFLYIVIILGSALGRSFLVLVLIFSVFSWIGLSYYIRAEYLKIRRYQYVDAARALGRSDFTIITRHILPNALTPLVTLVPFELIGAVFSLSALDYLGFGLPAPTPSWGELMNQGLQNLECYWLSIFPFLALFITLLLISFIGEGIREAINPREYVRTE